MGQILPKLTEGVHEKMKKKKAVGEKKVLMFGVRGVSV